MRWRQKEERRPKKCGFSSRLVFLSFSSPWSKGRLEFARFFTTNCVSSLGLAIMTQSDSCRQDLLVKFKQFFLPNPWGKVCRQRKKYVKKEEEPLNGLKLPRDSYGQSGQGKISLSRALLPLFPFAKWFSKEKGKTSKRHFFRKRTIQVKKIESYHMDVFTQTG